MPFRARVGGGAGLWRQQVEGAVQALGPTRRTRAFQGRWPASTTHACPQQDSCAWVWSPGHAWTPSPGGVHHHLFPGTPGVRRMARECVTCPQQPGRSNWLLQGHCGPPGAGQV